MTFVHVPACLLHFGGAWSQRAVRGEDAQWSSFPCDLSAVPTRVALGQDSDAAGSGSSSERRRHLVVVAGVAAPVLKVRSQEMPDGFVGPTGLLG